MINPNINMRVRVTVLPCENPNADHSFGIKQIAIFNGHEFEIHYRHGDKIKKAGSRYLYLKFSILAGDKYYLTVNY